MSLPATAGRARENAILDLVRQGHYEASFVPITSTHGENTAEFYVFDDALKIDGVRVNATAETEQVIADMTGCMLLTPLLADLIWQQATVRLPPFPRGDTHEMDSTQAMVDHSAKIDRALKDLGYPSGLKSTVGKHWLVDDDNDGHLIYGVPKAENYGWHFEGASFQGMPGETTASGIKDKNGHLVRMIQGRGWRHNMAEVDYSQTIVLVSLACKVNGVDRDLREILKDPVLSFLANHKGVLKVLRQHGVPEPTDHTIIMPMITVTPE